MYLPYDEELDIIVQHDDFLDKEFIKVKDLPKCNLPLNQNWSWDKILRSCFIKQADVLQGIYYFSDKFTFDEKKRNFDFYETYTVHESSLSPSIYSIIACEIDNLDKAYELYSRTARLDLDNYNNDTEELDYVGDTDVMPWSIDYKHYRMDFVPGGINLFRKDRMKFKVSSDCYCDTIIG